MNKIESIVDAIGKLNGTSDPESVAYRLRNPLLVKSFAIIGKHETDSEGRRIFSSILNGYRASLFDIELKISGKSRANVSADGTLEHLLACYGIQNSASVDYVVSFIRRALNNQTISKNTPLSFFREVE